MVNLPKIEHIGIAVKNLERAIQTFSNLGLTVSHREEVKEMSVKVAFLPLGESQLELLEPLHADSVIDRFLQKKGEGLHHVCIEVNNLPEMMKQLKSKNISFVYEEPKVGSRNTLVNFIHPNSAHGILIELSQKRSKRVVS